MPEMQHTQYLKFVKKLKRGKIALSKGKSIKENKYFTEAISRQIPTLGWPQKLLWPSSHKIGEMWQNSCLFKQTFSDVVTILVTILTWWPSLWQRSLLSLDSRGWTRFHCKRTYHTLPCSSPQTWATYMFTFNEYARFQLFWASIYSGNEVHQYWDNLVCKYSITFLTNMQTTWRRHMDFSDRRGSSLFEELPELSHTARM